MSAVLASLLGASWDSAAWKSWKFSEVMYRSGDPASFLLGVASLLPLIAICCLGAVTVAKADPRGLSALWVLLFNEGLNLAAKRVIRQQRPPAAWADSEELGHGMPSRHSQTAFCFATVLLFFFARTPSWRKRFVRGAFFFVARVPLKRGWA